MIKNARQYQLGKTQLERFQAALARHLQVAPAGKQDELRQLEADALQSQIQTLQQDIEEYESLIAGRTTVLEATSFEDLPRVLIQARIASGMSQKELADRLGLKEQQVQRYEATDYESASLARLNEVVRALGLKVRKDVLLPSEAVRLSTVWDRLNRIGLARDFVLNRLLPSSLAAHAEEVENDKSSDTGGIAMAIANVLARIFGFSTASVLSGDLPSLSSAATQTARFKLPARIRDGAMVAYAMYAHYLALVVLGTTNAPRRRAAPEDWQEVRAAILNQYGDITFAHALQYVWDLGVVVLPLNDPGVFHGACWRVDGRNVVVLKQRNRSAARWLIDLLHEFFHAMDYPAELNFSVVEEDEMSDARRQSDDEREATEFAADVALDGRADELAELCAHLAGGQIPRLKTVVQQVAEQEDVSVGVLANYLAYRLSLQGQNWWGTAHNLQKQDQEDPWQVARDVLLHRLDFARLNPLDRELVTQALSDQEARS